MSWELRGSDSRQGSAPHTHVRELDRPTDGGQVQPRVLIVRKYHGDEVGLRASHRWPRPGDDRRGSGSGPVRGTRASHCPGMAGQGLGVGTDTECGKRHGGKTGKDVLLLWGYLLLLFLFFLLTFVRTVHVSLFTCLCLKSRINIFSRNMPHP